MRRTAWQHLVLIPLLALAACSAGGTAGANSGPRTRADLITQEELQRGSFTNLYDAVQALRSRWLNTRGPDTLIGRQGEVQVHVDETRLGGVNALRSIPPVGVTSIQWFSPNDAAARWGLDHGHGAIVVSTRPR